MLPLDVIGLGGNPNSDGFDGDKLLGRIAKGDQEAFLQLYKNTDRTVYSFILSKIGRASCRERV